MYGACLILKHEMCGLFYHYNALSGCSRFVSLAALLMNSQLLPWNRAASKPDTQAFQLLFPVSGM